MSEVGSGRGITAHSNAVGRDLGRLSVSNGCCRERFQEVGVWLGYPGCLPTAKRNAIVGGWPDGRDRYSGTLQAWLLEMLWAHWVSGWQGSALSLSLPLQIEDGWWLGRKNGQVGAFPSNFVQELDRLPPGRKERGAAMGRGSRAWLPSLPLP